MGSKSSTSNPTTTTSQTDNRVAVGNDGANIGSFGTYKRNSDNSSAWNSGNTNRTSFQVNDSSSRDSSDRRTFSDSRDLSSRTDSRDMSTINYTGTDGGSVQIAKFNSGLLQAVSENQGDTVRALAQMGARGVTDQAAAATNLFATGSAEAGKAWGHTVDKSSELIDHLLTSASATVTGAQTVARDAISSYQPNENKTAGTMQYLLIAVAGLAAIFILKKA